MRGYGRASLVPDPLALRLDLHAFSHPGGVSTGHHQLMDEKLDIDFHNGVFPSTFVRKSRGKKHK